MSQATRQIVFINAAHTVTHFSLLILPTAVLAMAPPALVVLSKFFQNMFIRMGFLRYMVLTNLLLFMMLLPIKMYCRWLFNLKYFIHIQKYFFNI